MNEDYIMTTDEVVDEDQFVFVNQLSHIIQGVINKTIPSEVYDNFVMEHYEILKDKIFTIRLDSPTTDKILEITFNNFKISFQVIEPEEGL